MDDLTTDNEGENDTEEEKPEVKPPRSDNRFKDLSEKVETTAKERDEATAAKAAAEKELEFYKGFGKVANKFEGADSYEDKIKEKFLSGTDLEEATVTTLYKAGKLGNAPRQSPAGGSASTAIQSGDEKPTSEMTTAEKREKLVAYDRENPGDLTQTLRKMNL